jgi:hypothetical protein
MCVDTQHLRRLAGSRKKLGGLSIGAGAVRRGGKSDAGAGRRDPPQETTMRFMLLMIPRGYETAAPDTMPSADAVAAMMAYNDSLQKAGVLRGLDGLHPPSTGARVTFEGGVAKVSDGPFAEAKEVLGGYWMIDVASRAEAIAWATRCPASSNEIIEVRQVQEIADFPSDVQAVLEEYPALKAL